MNPTLIYCRSAAEGLTAVGNIHNFILPTKSSWICNTSLDLFQMWLITALQPFWHMMSRNMSEWINTFARLPWSYYLYQLWSQSVPDGNTENSLQLRVNVNSSEDRSNGFVYILGFSVLHPKPFSVISSNGLFSSLLTVSFCITKALKPVSMTIYIPHHGWELIFIPLSALRWSVDLVWQQQTVKCPSEQALILSDLLMDILRVFYCVSDVLTPDLQSFDSVCVIIRSASEL